MTHELSDKKNDGKYWDHVTNMLNWGYQQYGPIYVLKYLINFKFLSKITLIH